MVIFSFFSSQFLISKDQFYWWMIKCLLLETDKCHLFVSWNIGGSKFSKYCQVVKFFWTEFFIYELHFQVLIRIWCCSTIQSSQWCWHDLSSSSVSNGRLQMAFQWNRFNSLECSKLLLSLWKRCCHFGIGRTLGQKFYHFWGCSLRSQRHTI